MKINICAKYFFTFSLLLSNVWASLCSAQEKALIQIAHHATAPDEMPVPGAPMTISATLSGSKNSQLQMRALVVRDGKMLDIPVDTLTSNDNEQLVYSATINAPLAEIDYQFVLSGDAGIAATSKRYTLRRSCMPQVSDVNINIKAPQDTREKLKFLKKKSTDLQNEIQNYEQALKILEELKQLTAK